MEQPKAHSSFVFCSQSDHIMIWMNHWHESYKLLTLIRNMELLKARCQKKSFSSAKMYIFILNLSRLEQVSKCLHYLLRDSPGTESAPKEQGPGEIGELCGDETQCTSGDAHKLHSFVFKKDYIILVLRHSLYFGKRFKLYHYFIALGSEP